MIAACPKCQTRYRVDSERLGPDGARLRCSQCSAVFRVRLPEATPASVAALEPVAASAASSPSVAAPRPSAAPRGAAAFPEAPLFDRSRLVLVAHPNADACKRLAELLEGEGLQVLVAHDGVEAILSIQRALPRAVVLDAALPKMFGFQVCELVKRNESLRTIQVCLMGSIHKEERYRRAPQEIYGADFYVEPPALTGALLEWLARSGFPLRSRAESAAEAMPPPAANVASEVPAAPIAAPAGPASPAPARSAPRPEALPVGKPSRAAERAAAPAAKVALGRAGAVDPLGAERAQAERLARIIVSDIVLYNEEKFAAAVRSGNAREALRGELEEGRALFRERIDARIREERDFLADELERVARARGMA